MLSFFKSTGEIFGEQGCFWPFFRVGNVYGRSKAIDCVVFFSIRKIRGILLRFWYVFVGLNDWWFYIVLNLIILRGCFRLKVFGFIVIKEIFPVW